MMQRLLEGELRSDSITDSAPFAKASTQASNFSLCRRSAALAVMGMVSTLNWRKHSVRSARFDSFKPTNAARAADLRRMGRGAGTVAKALSIDWGRLDFRNTLWSLAGNAGNDPKGQHAKYRSVITFSEAREKGHYVPKAAPNEGFG